MKIPFADLDRVYVTSDTHAFHKNITLGTTEWSIETRTLANGNILNVRDFKNDVEMTMQMVDNFNSVIPKNGILIHHGDLSFGGKDNIARFRNLLNVETIHMITGNHDHHIERGDYDHLFTSRQKYLELEIGQFGFSCFHFPIMSWNNIRRGWFHLHGHLHWQGDMRFGNGRMMDVGVDGNNLFPYKLTDVIDMLKDRPHIPTKDDHHV